jgi:hypothetical protein
MKIEQLVYRVAEETLGLLEKRYHYRISDEHKKDIKNTIKDSINSLLAEDAGQEAG